MGNTLIFRGKRVLVMGLGLLGGGVATTKWFVRHGAEVTVTDMKTRRELSPSIRALGSVARRVRFVLGRHRAVDFKTNDVVVVNPGVPRESMFLEIARRAGRTVTNDAHIFFDAVENPIVAVTGTRGKTTTATWIVHLLRGRFRRVVAGGNSPDMPLLSLINRLPERQCPVVLELSSWQLERLRGAKRRPNVAVITNLLPDHLNRYRSLKDYAAAKANIFTDQGQGDALIVNHQNPWTKYFLSLLPRSRVYCFSTASLPRPVNGLSVELGRVLSQEGKRRRVVFGARVFRAVAARGAHNVENFLAAALAAHLAGAPWRMIASRAVNLPTVRYRQEVVLRRRNLTVVNDASATSPDAGMAGVARFAGPGLFLIAGGTDKSLTYDRWAQAVSDHVAPEHLYLLEGSATKKMVSALQSIHYFRTVRPQLFRTLAELLRAVRRRVVRSTRATILFSPAAASFEKFQNEFDRAERFNLYLRQLFTVH